MFVPLVVEHRAVGVLGLANKPGGFTANDASLASAFGELAAVSFLNAQRLEDLRDSEERFSSLAQSATDAIISADSEGNIIYWNRAAEAMFGYPIRETIGRPLQIHAHSRLPDRSLQSHLLR
jgi:PAS domain-containing protein